MAPTALTDTTVVSPTVPTASVQSSFIDRNSLLGKTIAITGGGRGLGLTLAVAVAEAGGHVACLDILPEPAAAEWDELRYMCKAAGVTVSYVRCDVTSEIEVSRAFEEIAEKSDILGAPFAGVIACAGIQQKVPALEYDAQDFERILRVNVTGAFLTAKHSAKILVEKKRPGSIVLIASMSGQIANRVCEHK